MISIKAPNKVILIVASLRLGGEQVSYGHHVLIVGDAAGMIDPLTGKVM